MQEPTFGPIDVEKLLLDFDYYEQVVKYHLENGRFCFSLEDRVKIMEAGRYYRMKGFIKPIHNFKNFAPFA